MLQVTESQLKALSDFVPLTFIAVECCGGYNLIAQAESLGRTVNEYTLFTTNDSKPRKFKKLDTLKNTIRALGLAEFTLTIKP